MKKLMLAMTLALAVCLTGIGRAGADAEPVSASIEGTVTDSVTGEPVENATVHLSYNGAAESAQTDQDGVFRFQKPDASGGTYTVSAEKEGYEQSQQGAPEVMPSRAEGYTTRTT